MTLRRRFSLLVAAQTAVLLLSLSGLLYLTLQRFLEANESQRLEEAYAYLTVDERLGGLELDDGGDDERHEAREITLAPAVPDGVHVRLVLGGSVAAEDDAFPDLTVVLPDGFSEVQGHQVLVREVRHDDAVVTVQLAVDRARIRAPLASYLRALAISVPAMMLLAALAAGWTAGRLLTPIRSLERATRAVADGGTDRLRADLPGATTADELGSLARTLERSFRRLADGLDRERDFVRAAAHDLRSPLTALAARVQGTLARPRDADAYRAELAEIDADVRSMTRLTEHLLLLARDPSAMRRTRFDLARLAGERVDRARDRVPDVDLDLAVEGDGFVEGDEALLTHLIDNLVQNALVHGGGAPVRVAVTQQDDTVGLTVEDRGPGVPPDELERLMQPFYRGDANRTSDGSGLGLAIVARIAELHGGVARLEAVRPHGLRVVVIFPARG